MSVVNREVNNENNSENNSGNNSGKEEKYNKNKLYMKLK